MWRKSVQSACDVFAFHFLLPFSSVVTRGRVSELIGGSLSCQSNWKWMEVEFPPALRGLGSTSFPLRNPRSSHAILKTSCLRNHRSLPEDWGDGTSHDDTRERGSSQERGKVLRMFKNDGYDGWSSSKASSRIRRALKEIAGWGVTLGSVRKKRGRADRRSLLVRSRASQPSSEKPGSNPNDVP